jgi:hypothetical protein
MRDLEAIHRYGCRHAFVFPSDECLRPALSISAVLASSEAVIVLVVAIALSRALLSLRAPARLIARCSTPLLKEQRPALRMVSLGEGDALRSGFCNLYGNDDPFCLVADLADLLIHSVLHRRVHFFVAISQPEQPASEKPMSSHKVTRVLGRGASALTVQWRMRAAMRRIAVRMSPAQMRPPALFR